MELADRAGVGFRCVEEIIAWQLAIEFRNEVTRLLRGSREAWRNLRYRDQLLKAMDGTDANIAEGFHRGTPPQFLAFLNYARASHAEAERRFKTGISRGYFEAGDCVKALNLAKRCCMAILRLIQSIKRFE
jgi:four helix bundle protein